MVKRRAGAIIAARNPLLIINRKQITDLAIRNRLALMTEGGDFVESGALASYASDDVANFKRAAVYVDKILKGAKPAELPVEQSSKFELVINGKTAAALGLKIPQSLRITAEKVIE